MRKQQPSIEEPRASAGLEPRRLPVQARSKERVDRILDAATQLLQEEGYNAVKTNQIARRAGVSIGSVYQFFPNRFAIFHALAERYQVQIAEILADKMGPDSLNRPWQAVVSEVIDILAGMWQSDQAFHTVWMAIKNTAELRDAEEYYRNHEIYEILENYLQRVLPRTAEENLDVIAHVLAETTNLLLDNSMRDGGKQDATMVAELKFLLLNYLRGHIEGNVSTQYEPTRDLHASPPTSTKASTAKIATLK